MFLFSFKKQKKLEIELILAKKGYSKSAFSKKIDVSKSYFSQILSGKRKAGTVVAYKIAKGLDMDVEDLFFIESVH